MTSRKTDGRVTTRTTETQLIKQSFLWN